jgi:hydrogenase maturation protease
MIFPEGNRKVILGLGNLLNHDEGFGVHAVELLPKHMVLPPDVELVDGGVLGLDLLPLVESCSYLLVLDAIDAGLPPGSVVQWQNEQIPLYAGAKLSEHQIGFQEVLGLALFRDAYPKNLHLLGVQPEDLSLGIGLSSTIQAALPKVFESTQAILSAWGNGARLEN